MILTGMDVALYHKIRARFCGVYNHPIHVYMFVQIMPSNRSEYPGFAAVLTGSQATLSNEGMPLPSCTSWTARGHAGREVKLTVRSVEVKALGNVVRGTRCGQ